MERFNALGRGMQLMLVAGVLLLIVMFFPWQDFGPEIVEFSGWEGFTGVVLGLLTIVVVAWVVLRLLAVTIPLPVSQALVTAAAGGLLVLFAVLKLLTIIDDEATVWAYIGFILALLVGLGTWMTVQAAGGMDVLKGEISSLQSAAPTEQAPAAEAPPPPPETAAAPPAGEPAPPAEPEAPAEPDEPSEPDYPRGA